jgi:transglutaminase-like putative cysteine protease
MMRRMTITLSACLLAAALPPFAGAQSGPAGLGGSVWSGSESLDGYGALRFEFFAGGKVEMTDARDRVSGTYTQEGTRVRLAFFNGRVVYNGTVNGPQLAGSAGNGRTDWKWSVRRLGAATRDQQLDRHALQTPKEAEATLRSLTVHLLAPARTEREKVRVLYRWVTDRVEYDLTGYVRGVRVDARAESVLRLRKGVCEGYAVLFQSLCQLAGLEAVIVRGYCKGYGHYRGEPVSTNHAWNAVRIDGRWHLVDATWGAGYVDGKRYTKSFNEFYYLARPDQLIFSHFPDDAKWQLLDRPLTKRAFEQLPEVSGRVFELGFTSGQVRAAKGRPGFRGVVGTYTPKGGTLRVLEAPVQRHLKAGQSYRFRIESPDVASFRVETGGQLKLLTRRGTVFEVTVTPERGALSLAHTLPGDQSGTYWTLLSYDVE